MYVFDPLYIGFGEPTSLICWLFFLLNITIGPYATLIYMHINIVERVRKFKYPKESRMENEESCTPVSLVAFRLSGKC
jgi:hypothetical protein